MDDLDTREFVSERNIHLNSFKTLGVSKIIVDIGWRQTVCDVKENVPRIIREFYANLSEDVDSEGKLEFQKVFVRGHAYEFDNFEKDCDMDVTASELLSMNGKWPGKKTLKVSDLTLKYVGLHKVVMTNWWPTSHYPTILEDFACFLFDIGTRFLKLFLVMEMEGKKGKYFHILL